MTGVQTCALPIFPRDPTIITNWAYDRSNRQPQNDFIPNTYQIQGTGTASLTNHPVYVSWWDKNLNILVPQQSRLHFGFGCAISVQEEDPRLPGYVEFDPYKFDKLFELGYRYNIAIGFLDCVEK